MDSMKKFTSLVVVLMCLASPAWADGGAIDDSNWGIQSTPSQIQAAPPVSNSEQTWKDTVDTTIYNKYGSEYSPAFQNRENINPNESDYNYGASDGVE